MKSYSALVQAAAIKLKEITETPRLDAELLLEAAAGVSRLYVVAHGENQCPHDKELLFENFVSRRAQGEPVALIVGKKEFYGREFEVTSQVLVPRPETELLVEEALKQCKTRNETPRILDLGTGSGCISISIAAECSSRGCSCAEIVAVDKSSAALCVALRNAVRHGTDTRISFVCSDWLSAIASFGAAFDIVVSNPPYVSDADAGLRKELRFEPRSALVARGDGTADVFHLLETVPGILAPGGVFLCEIGFDQADRVSRHARTVGWKEVSVLKDLAGCDRVLKCRMCCQNEGGEMKEKTGIFKRRDKGRESID